ncbi:MAG TPA: PD-(D/E)XK nuclease family protein [Planctomycetota bacterium]|nr:PD-(D/E)XK nuclease family protein [Planctomycetota bacterium]
MKCEFAALLDEFRVRRNNQALAATRAVYNFAKFLDDFGWRLKASPKVEQKLFSIARFQEFLDKLGKRIGEWRDQKRQTGVGFNVFDVFGLATNELAYSNLLAWLLRCDYRYPGSHCQGAIGLRAFLKILGLPESFSSNEDYEVRREVSYDNARVDIQIWSRNRFLIGIESKIEAIERQRQTHDEWDGMLARASQLNIAEGDTYGYFITRSGVLPESKNFRPLTWGTVSMAFEIFAEEAGPPEIRLFARHCAQALAGLSNTGDREDN